jgi:hypothetical protein
MPTEESHRLWTLLEAAEECGPAFGGIAQPVGLDGE